MTQCPYCRRDLPEVAKLVDVIGRIQQHLGGVMDPGEELELLAALENLQDKVGE